MIYECRNQIISRYYSNRTIFSYSIWIHTHTYTHTLTHTHTHTQIQTHAYCRLLFGKGNCTLESLIDSLHIWDCDSLRCVKSQLESLIDSLHIWDCRSQLGIAKFVQNYVYTSVPLALSSAPTSHFIQFSLPLAFALRWEMNPISGIWSC